MQPMRLKDLIRYFDMVDMTIEILELNNVGTPSGLVYRIYDGQFNNTKMSEDILNMYVNSIDTDKEDETIMIWIEN